MNEGHLTEFQMQEYLDGQSRDSAGIREHLDTCRLCRETVESYRTLYGALKEEPEMKLNSALRSRVMTRIAPARRFRISFETGFSAGFFLISMITVGYVTGFSFNFGMISGFFNSLIELLPRFNFKIISDNILFIVVPLLIILIIEVLDKKILKLKF
jgi:hypothetical protein